MAVAVVLFNDYGYGCIRELQKWKFNGRGVGSGCHPVPFHEIARSIGARRIRVGEIKEVKPVLTRIFSSGKPGVLKISIEPQKTGRIR